MGGHPAKRLVADLGGTNARFAVVQEGVSVTPEAMVYRTPLAAHADFSAALADFRTDWAETHGVFPDVSAVLIAAAGPIDRGAASSAAGDSVALTNAPWRLEASEISAALDGVPVALFNDLEAVALALPWLGTADADIVRGGSSTELAPRLALNLGTGFGAAVALPSRSGGWHALATEPGHMRFAAVTEAERALLDMIETVEDLCSGRGVAALYARLAGLPKRGPDAAEIFALSEVDATAKAVCDLMLTVAGRVAGDLVLATGSWGGVWLTGGVVSAWRDAWTTPFLEHFDYKGPMTARMRSVPIRRIAHPYPALLGLSRTPLST